MSAACCCLQRRYARFVPQPPAPTPSPGPQAQAVTETALTKFQLVRRLPNGNFAGVTGDAVGTGVQIVGVAMADYAIGDLATVAKSGGFVPGIVPAGDLFRDGTGLPVPWASLVQVPPPNTTYTNFVGVGSAIGLDVDLDAEQPIAGP